jgi:hypothetical protein
VYAGELKDFLVGKGKKNAQPHFNNTFEHHISRASNCNDPLVDFSNFSISSLRYTKKENHLLNMFDQRHPSLNGIVAGPHDVLLGRGGGTNNHSGNKNFRELVNAHKRRYLACSKVEKPKVAREVVETWRKMNPPGRFLQRLNDPKSSDPPIFQEVSEKKAREKASQCLRERTPDVLPYLNQYHQEQDQFTEEGVGKVQLKIQMTGKKEAAAAAAAAAGADMPDQPVSSMSSHSHHSSPPVVRRTSTPTVSDLHGQPNKQDLELQQLYARQQQVLRDAYKADDPQKAHQDAIHIAHQQALQDRQILERQRQMLMQQQLAMQKQMIQNNMMAQHLMMTQNGLARAAGISSPMSSPASRRQSLSTGLSQMAINISAVSPSPHSPQNGLHHRNPSMASHMMANNIPAPPLHTSGHMPQSYAPMPAHVGSGMGSSLIPESDDSRRGTSPLSLTDDKGKKLQPSPPSGTKDSTVPRVIATNSNLEVEDLMKLPLPPGCANETPKQDNRKFSKTNMGGPLDDLGSTFQLYTTNLNDFESDHEIDHDYPDPNTYFDDDSSEELLKDHSKFHESMNSNGSGEFSFTRKKNFLASRASSMSIGTSSFMSLSAMEYSADLGFSADLSREQKMSATRSNGSNRSMMSELTDYEHLQL